MIPTLDPGGERRDLVRPHSSDIVCNNCWSVSLPKVVIGTGKHRDCEMIAGQESQDLKDTSTGPQVLRCWWNLMFWTCEMSQRIPGSSLGSW